MSATAPTHRDMEQYVAEQIAQPVYFPPFAAVEKPTAVKFRHRGIYITDTSKPAWMDVSGVWRYADGSMV